MNSFLDGEVFPFKSRGLLLARIRFCSAAAELRQLIDGRTNRAQQQQAQANANALQQNLQQLSALNYGFSWWANTDIATVRSTVQTRWTAIFTLLLSQSPQQFATYLNGLNTTDRFTLTMLIGVALSSPNANLAALPANMTEAQVKTFLQSRFSQMAYLPGTASNYGLNDPTAPTFSSVVANFRQTLSANPTAQPLLYGASTIQGSLAQRVAFLADTDLDTFFNRETIASSLNSTNLGTAGVVCKNLSQGKVRNQRTCSEISLLAVVVEK